MSFINYFMTDKDREKINFPVFTTRDGRRPTLYKWSVDAERDAFLVIADKTGGAHGDSYEVCNFVLVYKGFLIAFVASNEFWKMAPPGSLAAWKVCGLDVPAEVGEAEAKAIIEDALKSYGKGWDGEIVKVGVDFIC